MIRFHCLRLLFHLMMYSLLYQLNIIVNKLTSELAADYINFFDTTPHATGREEHKCYCIWWSNMDIEGESYGTVEERSNLAVKYINNGNIQGYLAYYNGKAVGWRNANTKSECYNSFCWKMSMGSVHKDTSSVKVKSVSCFCVSPDMRGKGVAERLLRPDGT